MTPTLRLEVEMSELGVTRRERRIAIASGTHDPKIVKRMKQMLVDLRVMGRLDLVRAIRDRRLKPLVVWGAYKFHRLDALPTEEEMVSLSPELERFRLVHEVSAKHKTSLLTSYTALLRQASSPTVADLPALLLAYRDECRGVHPRSFNLAKAAAQAFARNTIGKGHKVYVALQAIPNLPYKRGKGHPQLPGKAADIASILGEPWGSMWWAMCCTGMGPDEYWGGWHVEDDRISIHGTKTEARERFVPFIAPIVTPSLTPSGMHSRFRKIGLTVTLYDARRSFTLWMIEAGITLPRRKMYLGHEPATVQDLYEQHEVDDFLEMDAKRLRRFIGRPLQRQMRVVG